LACFKLYERADIKKPSFCSGCKSKGIAELGSNNLSAGRCFDRSIRNETERVPQVTGRLFKKFECYCSNVSFSSILTLPLRV
jgi:hypothetical protein